MLPKAQRLTSRYEFNKTRYLANKNNTKASSPFFYLYYADIYNFTEPTKFGIVISTRLDKSAVKRNRLKRQYREIIRENFAKIKPGYWVVLHPTKRALTKSYAELNTDFTKTIQKTSFAE